jgi:hypothetical protein
MSGVTRTMSAAANVRVALVLSSVMLIVPARVAR